MIITNKHNLPIPYYNAVVAFSKKYDKGNAKYSCTELVKPVLMRWLEKKYDDVIEIDCSDMFWSLFGTAMHKILEEASGGDANIITERRIFAEVCGVRISGQADVVYVDSSEINDYKVTKAWSYVFGPKPEWVSQLNILAHLSRLNGENPKALKNILFIRDLDKKRIGENHYPVSDLVIMDIPLWHPDQAKAYTETRVGLHEYYSKAERPEDVIPCTKEERWTRNEKWAIVQKGKKRATRLFDTEEEAVSAASQQKIVHKVEHRQGTFTRCEGGYCSAAKFCPLMKK